MARKEPEVPDYAGDLYRDEYCPGIVRLLRKLTNLNEKTFKEVQEQLGNSPVDEKRLSILLSENLKQIVQEAYQIGTLSQLSLNAMRERSAHPHLYKGGR